MQKARTPLVSVIMPSLNQAHFIKESLLSVLNQITDKPFEVIVMDGISSDGTQEILTKLSKKYPYNLRWYSEKDTRPANAINKAIVKTKGKIIGWLNSDDLYFDGAIQRTINAFNNNPGWKMLYGNGLHINKEGEPIGYYPTMVPETSIYEFRNSCFICQPTVIYHQRINR